MTFQSQDRQGLRHGELDSGKRNGSCDHLHVAYLISTKLVSMFEDE
jgi:hypothetical protein